MIQQQQGCTAFSLSNGVDETGLIRKRHHFQISTVEGPIHTAVEYQVFSKESDVTTSAMRGCPQHNQGHCQRTSPRGFLGPRGDASSTSSYAAEVRVLERAHQSTRPTKRMDVDVDLHTHNG